MVVPANAMSSATSPQCRQNINHRRHQQSHPLLALKNSSYRARVPAPVSNRIKYTVQVEVLIKVLPSAQAATAAAYRKIAVWATRVIRLSFSRFWKRKFRATTAPMSILAKKSIISQVKSGWSAMKCSQSPCQNKVWSSRRPRKMGHAYSVQYHISCMVIKRCMTSSDSKQWITSIRIGNILHNL